MLRQAGGDAARNVLVEPSGQRLDITDISQWGSLWFEYVKCCWPWIQVRRVLRVDNVGLRCCQAVVCRSLCVCNVEVQGLSQARGTVSVPQNAAVNAAVACVVRSGVGMCHGYCHPLMCTPMGVCSVYESRYEQHDQGVDSPTPSIDGLALVAAIDRCVNLLSTIGVPEVEVRCCLLFTRTASKPGASVHHAGSCCRAGTVGSRPTGAFLLEAASHWTS